MHTFKVNLCKNLQELGNSICKNSKGKLKLKMIEVHCFSLMEKISLEKWVENGYLFLDIENHG